MSAAAWFFIGGTTGFIVGMLVGAIVTALYVSGVARASWEDR